MTARGPELSRIVAGMMRLDQWDLHGEGLASWIQACIDMGVTTFDHADIYGGFRNEAIFGEALATNPGLRNQMEIVTKCDILYASEAYPDVGMHIYNTSKAHIIHAAERSLTNLQTDVIDLLLIHRPDPLLDADEVAAALNELQQAGKVKHFGVSNFSPSQFELLQSRLDTPLVTNQVQFSAMYLDPIFDGTFDLMQQRRVAPMIWSPVAGGRMFRDEDEGSRRVRDALAQVGEELGGAPLDQVALAWTMRHPVGVVPVLGTGKLERIENAVAAESLALTREQWFTILVAAQGHDIP